MLILIFALSIIKPSFVYADDTLTVEVPVSYDVFSKYDDLDYNNGPSGTIMMIPWQKELKDVSYQPGPALEQDTINIADASQGKFIIKFTDVGNYVYEIRQINKTNENLVYDVDIDSSGESDKIYRFYITVAYADEDHIQLEAYMEAESCDDYACTLSPEQEEQTDMDYYSDQEKPTDVSFVNNVCYWVKYEDGDHGKSDRLGNESRLEIGYIHMGGNTVTPDPGYKFTGEYTFVVTDLDGKIIRTGTISEADLLENGFEIDGNVTFTPVYKKVPVYPPWMPPITGVIMENPQFYGSLFAAIIFILFVALKRRKKAKQN